MADRTGRAGNLPADSGVSELHVTDQQIPEAAITAATVAVHDVDCPDRKCSGPALGYSRKLALAALEAAAPVIAAAERERLAGLARRILAGDARAFTELATILDDALECGS